MAEERPATVVRRVGWRRGEPGAAVMGREWLVTNGLGGFASLTMAMTASRRYHGVLVAALPGPVGRVVMVSRVDEDVVDTGGRARRLGGTVTDGVPDVSPDADAVELSLEQGLPVWTVRLSGGAVVERRVLMPHRQNTVHVSYRLLEGAAPVVVRLRPLVQCRPLEDPVSAPLHAGRECHIDGDRCEVQLPDGMPALQLRVSGARALAGGEIERQWYALEAARGYESSGELWSPCVFEVSLEAGASVCLVASTEAWPACMVPSPDEAPAAERRRRDVLLARAHPALRSGVGAELVFAADQFLISPQGRVEDVARAHAEGDEVSTVIAGYHWFTDWGRDTMISLDGLTLATGRLDEAGAILRAFARHVWHGLIPNLFPEGSSAGLYHTADATLWFFHALHRYVTTSGDMRTLRDLLPQLHDIVDWHVRGTDFNIGVDPTDGLLRQGAPGFQLTWMDAKVGDWVVTPRRGKAVELQGLWYNALRLLEGWSRDACDVTRAERYRALAARAHESFNRRFWNDAAGQLFDVVDGEHGDDDSCRPNQLLSFSLEHPVLDESRRAAVLAAVTQHLLTPVGLRSLAPGSPGYHARYDGDRRARDAAYHQGTVWPWLIGPYIAAWRTVNGASADVAPLLEGLLGTLSDDCVGQLNEIFDAEAPYSPRGCIAQAWSVAEVLRCLAQGA